MRKIKITLIALATLALVVISCSKDSGATDSTTTVTQDKLNITNTINDFYTCLNTLDDGDLSNFLLYSLFNTSNQQYNDSWMKTMLNKFETQYGKIVLNNKLQFANRTGIYTWNNTYQTWSKVANSSVITLKFPSRQTLTTNDAELSLNSYGDSSTSYQSTTYWLPTNANLTLKRDNNTVFSLNLANVTFDTSTNFSMPTNADITIYSAPFTTNLHWKRNTSTDFELSFDSSTTQGCGTSSVTNIKLVDADYGNITSVKDDVKSINGTLIEGNLKVVYAINVQALAAYTNPTPSQINSYSDAEVFYNNVKIGDLSYDKVANQTEIFITYSDGTKENVNIYVGDFETHVRSIFSNFLN